MSETAVPQGAHPTVNKARGALLWQPVLFRSMATLLFGIITVFFGAPGTLGLCLNFGWYFVVLGLSHYWIVRRLALPRGDAKRLALMGAAALLAVAGVVVFIAVSTVLAAWLGAAALAVMGAAELYAALTSARSQLRSDWLISGVLGLGTGVLLPFFITSGPHGLLGVSGGGALMTGALWLLSALTLRHDTRTPKGK
ncbi:MULTISPECIES: DUF308 domain-containing protein [unclassified Arthrobacter]|uniref:DUF308 domain-containing protein n=1 Tax=unclassified Arthrobacter TaxID=235627 RepID=UPI00159D9C99|nr:MULTISPECIES: DUF308 domain-containing protein [unclassified Arthrobacter]MCQ9163772.1 DUF308 domain-containing protein [Arthrobacter sp. STN4]NVM99443.1 hypothetical protein [Arthrobacter sp. SDTb3-6]